MRTTLPLCAALTLTLAGAPATWLPLAPAAVPPAASLAAAESAGPPGSVPDPVAAFGSALESAGPPDPVAAFGSAPESAGPPGPFAAFGPPGLAGSSAWRWPLEGTPRLVRRFDPPPQRWLPGHRGVDLSAPPGTPVLAASGGTVVFAGRLAGRGVVSVAHPGGMRTTYEPVDAVVAAGDAVAAGRRLGTLAAGHPGCPAPACLHWGLRRGEAYLDPLAVLGLGRVRLLPTRAAAPAGPRRGARTRRRGCRSAR